MDIRQNRVLSVPLPIVVHQGKTKFQYESTSEYFAHVPEQLKQYIPQVEYVVLDLSQFDYQQLRQISNWLLYHFLMTLKGGKDNVFLEQYSEEIIIFAPEYANIPFYIRIYTMSIVYLTNTSKKFNKKVQSMGTQEITTPYIKKLKRSQSFIVQLIAENLEKGIEKGVEKAVITFLEKSPEIPDTQVAHLFDISVETVQQLRASITKG